MIVSFKNSGTEDIFDGANSKAARQTCPQQLMIRVPKYRPPIHPGEMLQEEFLQPMGLTQRELAAAIHVPYQRVNEIINGKRGVTPSTALRLGKFFGMTAAFWLNLQLRWDLYHAQQAEQAELAQIHQRQPLQAAVGVAA
jgi:addiction module HigA family antidote